VSYRVSIHGKSHKIKIQGIDLTYCQSNERENRPSPSLLVAPPKMLVNVSALEPVAFCAARHCNDKLMDVRKAIYLYESRAGKFTYRDRDGVQPWEDISRNYFI